MPDNSLRCLIVGLGGITRQTAPVLQGQAWFTAAGAVDIADDAAARANELFGLESDAVHSDLDAALAATTPSAVIINTPSELHYAQCKAALEAGAHVLVAKPFTNNFEEATELVALAEKQNVTVSVWQQMRFVRHYEAMRRFVASGKIGEIEAIWFMNSKPRPNPANLAAMKQPALYENSCHHFDSLLAVCGDPVPEWISCDGFIPSWSPYVGPCMVNALIRCSGNLHIAYHGGFSSRAPMYEFRIEGTEGALRCRGLHMSNPNFDYEYAPALNTFEPVDIERDVPAGGHATVLEQWHAYVQGGPEPAFSGRYNLKPFAMLSAAIDAMDSGQPVEIARNARYVAAFA